jgi:hypothetical protein
VIVVVAYDIVDDGRRENPLNALRAPDGGALISGYSTYDRDPIS